MIRSVKSNNQNFKPVVFHSGFNIVLADRNRGSAAEEKCTRNGAGKRLYVNSWGRDKTQIIGLCRRETLWHDFYV